MKKPRCYSERSGAKRNEVEESRGITLRFGCGVPRLLPRTRDSLGMTTVTSFLSLLELFLSQPEQEQQLRLLPFSR